MPRDGDTAATPGPPEAIRAKPIIMGATDYGLIALQAMFWGSAFFFIAVARHEIPPFTLSMMRLVPAVLFLLMVISAIGLRLPATLPEWWRLLIFSLLNNVLPMTLIITAQSEVTGGIAAIFMATAPLMTLIIAPWFVAEETFTWLRFVGILVGIAGVAVLVGVGGSGGSWKAQAMLLSAALCFSVANIYARHTLGGYHPFVVASAQTIGSLLLAALAAVAIEQPWTLTGVTSRGWLATLLMGLIASGLAPLCHFTVLKRAGPVNAMLASIVVPVTPILLGATFLGEHLQTRELIGGIIVAMALIIIDGRLPGLFARGFKPRGLW